MNARNDNGVTLLISAAINGREAIVKELINVGAKISTMDSFGYTLLMRAAQNGHPRIVKMLKTANRKG